MHNAFKILDARGDDFRNLPGVTGVGVGYRGTDNEVLCFIVSVESEDVKIDLPQTIEGLPACREVSVCREVNAVRLDRLKETY